MKEWVALGANDAAWVGLAREAHAFVGALGRPQKR
jgi:hypothetical protein